MIRPFIFSICFASTFAIVACTADQDLGGCADAGLKSDGAVEQGDSATDDGSLHTDDGSTGSDGGSDAGGGGDGGFSVKDLPGLALWLDIDNGVVADPAQAGSVKRWLDQSGNGNDANIFNTPEPTIDPSAVHGHNAVICSTGGLQIVSSPSLAWGTGDWAVLMVVKAEVGGGQGMVLWNEDDGPDPILYIQLNGTSDFAAQAGNATVAVANSTANFQLLALRGSAMRITDGAGSATGGTNTLGVGATAITLCSANINLTPYELTEVIAIKGALSDADLASLTTYAKNKYGLP